MSQSIRILLLDAGPADSEPLRRELAKSHITCEITQVDSRDAFLKAMGDLVPDVIFSEFKVRDFAGLDALKLAREFLPETPCIFVSGHHSDELEAEAIRCGATDCVSRQKLHRLGPVVERALREAEDRLERRRADEGRHESEARFRAVFDSAAIGILMVDPAGYVILSNRAAREMFSFDEAELRQMRFRDLSHPQDGDEDLALFKELLDEKRTTYQVEQRCLSRDKTAVWARITVSIVREKSGAPQFAIRMMENVTERKTLEGQLRQVQKMDALGRLAGGVAHDFNNVLTAIMGFSEMALESIKPGDPVRDMIVEVHKAGERAKSLTTQLLAFSRKQTLQPVVLNLNDEVKSIEKMLRRLLGEQLELSIQLDGELGKIRADRGQIEQVIMNLALNSRDAMPHGGRLTIRTLNVEVEETPPFPQTTIAPGNYVSLSVVDSGIGMDPDTLAHIFEPFFTTKPKGKGTGLGLATVYGIVQQSNGTIVVESGIGKGTTFRIYLPRINDQPSPTASINETSTRKTLKGTETILIAEDDNAVRVLAFEMLKRQGYRVLDAENGEEALRVARSHAGPIHLLLSDLGMPGMNGPELARRLLEIRGATKVLYMSGHSGDDLAVRSTIGADAAVMEKPFTQEIISVRVRNALDRKRDNKLA